MSQSKFALPRNGFTFKQFFVAHDRCAMKVGTDGILLGAWAPIAQVKHVLDIGTGSGLLALMLAQRTDDRVMLDAVELDEEATAQARENVATSRGGRVSRCIRGIFNSGSLRKPDAMN
jgi:tRNA1Val (adenine37-N6)-methyltransferase